jgi:hypothetical protein
MLIIPILRAMLLGGIVLAGVMGVMIVPSHAELAPTNPATARMLTGTIDDFDWLHQLVILRTEEQGERLVRFLEVADPTMMKGLIKGNHIVVELDDLGRAKKILQAAADLKETPNPKD